MDRSLDCGVQGIDTGGPPMKLGRSLIVFSAGVAAGLALARKMTEDEPEVLHGPSTAAGSGSPGLRVVTSGTSRIADKVGVASLDAIRKTRTKIRERLGDDADDAAWS
jgi:hypothetical protein